MKSFISYLPLQIEGGSLVGICKDNYSKIRGKSQVKVKSIMILLFAFRNSHIKFFEKLKKDKSEYEIINSKALFGLSISGLKDIKKVDLDSAVDFAVDELYAKTELNFPKVLIRYIFIGLAYFNYMRYYSVLSNNKYKKMLIWNGGKFRQRIAIEIAKLFDIEIYYFENGLLPHRIVLDNKGINYDNSVPRDIQFFKNYSNAKQLPSSIVPRVGKHQEKFSVEKQQLPDKYIFVPFQVDYDTQIITNSKWIHNMRELFSLIEELASKVEYNFILKEHPSSGKNYPDLHTKVQNISNISFANGYSTQELIERSLAVITINSTVGVESLLFHKKVIVLGNAFYGIKGLTFPIKTLEELIKTVHTIETVDLDTTLVDNFLKYLYYDYLIDKDEKIVYDKFHQILTQGKQ